MAARRALLALALALAACGGAPAGPPASSSATASAPANAEGEVRVEADATMGELLAALEAALRARGHEGECFLAWDAAGEPAISVRVGDRARSAALSCGGLEGIASVIEGRCIAARWAWIDPERRTRGLTFYFAPPGVAHTTAAPRIGPTAMPATEVVFHEAPTGVRVVLGVELSARAVSAAEGSAGASAGAKASAKQSPLEDPEVRQGIEQAVVLAQPCNPGGEGSLVLRWRVLPDGEVEGVQRLSSTVSEEAERCAVERLSRVSFPEHDRATPDEYCVPVMLDPALR